MFETAFCSLAKINLLAVNPELFIEQSDFVDHTPPYHEVGADQPVHLSLLLNNRAGNSCRSHHPILGQQQIEKSRFQKHKQGRWEIPGLTFVRCLRKEQLTTASASDDFS